MKEKDRILNLVQKGIISMDEALTLLEASENEKDAIAEEQSQKISKAQGGSVNNKSTSDVDDQLEDIADKLISTGKNFTSKIGKFVQDKMKQADQQSQELDFSDEYIQDQQREQERFFANNDVPGAVSQGMLEDISVEFAEKQQHLQDLSEQQMITQQRLRELEIFQEMDDLTEEMRLQQETLMKELSNIEEQIQEVTDQLAKLDAKRAHLGIQSSGQISESIQDKAGEFTKNTLDFADDAIKGGQRVSKDLLSQVKGFIKNFNMKDVNLSFEVPWVKTQSIDHVFEIDATDVNRLDLKIINGSLEILTHDKDTIEIDSELRFHGNFDEFTSEVFKELSTIYQEEGQLIFHVTSPRLSTDATIYLPEKDYADVKIKLTNGDLSIENLTIDNLNLHNKNGDMILENSTIINAEISNVNGGLEFLDVTVKELLAKTLSGDIVLKGDAETSNLETVSGDIYVTKLQNTSSHIQAKAMNGDIKMSQPAELSLDIDAKSTSGDVYERLEGDMTKSINEDQSMSIFQRNYGEGSAQLNATIRVISGDIWLKDRN